MKKNNKFCFIGLSILLVVTTLFMFPCNAYASDVVGGQSDSLEFNLPYAEPTCDDNSGYFTMIYRDSLTGNYKCWTYFWTIIDKVEYTTDVAMAVKFYNNILSFTPQVFGDHYASVTLANYTCDNKLNVCYTNKLYTSSFGACFEDAYSNYYCSGIAYGGNVILETNFQNWNVPVLDFSSSSDDIALRDTITDIFSILSDIEGDTTQLLTLVSSIISQNTATNNKLTQIYNLLNTIHVVDNARIIELLEQIEYYLAYPDNGSGAKVDSFGNSIEQGSSILNESNREKDESLVYDENGVGADDIKEHNNTVSSLIDSVMSHSLTLYTEILNVFTEFPRVTQLIVVSLCFAYVGFVLFGRR